VWVRTHPARTAPQSPHLRRFSPPPQTTETIADARCNRALLRLYNLFPARASAAYTTTALALALQLNPEPEFLQLLYMVPTASYTPAIKALVELDALLSGADFTAVWPRVASPEIAPVISKLAGFSGAVRDYAFGAVNRTYSRIEASVFAAILNLPEGEAVAFAIQRGCTQDGADLVLPAIAENSDRRKAEKVTVDALTRNEISSILSILTR